MRVNVLAGMTAVVLVPGHDGMTISCLDDEDRFPVGAARVYGRHNDKLFLSRDRFG
jgi:hypothetical protein